MIITPVITPVISPVITYINSSELPAGGVIYDSFRINGPLIESILNSNGDSDLNFSVINGATDGLKLHPTGSMRLDAGADGRAFTPIQGAFDRAVSFVLYFSGTLDDFTTSPARHLSGQYDTSINARAFRLGMDSNSTGFLECIISTSGSFQSGNLANSSIPITDRFSSGDRFYAFAFVDLVNDQVTFSTSTDVFADPVSAYNNSTQLGDVQGIDGGTIFDSTANFTVGASDNGGSACDGTCFKAGMIQNGQLIAPFDASKAGNKVSGDMFTIGSTTWTLNGGSAIQNTGSDVATTFRNAPVSIETPVSTLYTDPVTLFIVARASDLNDQRLFGARATESQSPQFNISGGNFIFNAGATLTIGPADTDFHIFYVRYNLDGTTTAGVSGVGEVTGNAGSEPLDYATLFSNASAGGEFWAGSFKEAINYFRALSNSEFSNAYNSLAQSNPYLEA